MKIESMEDLFLGQIEDLYDAERRLVKALPKMAKAATSEPLRAAFESHLEETKGHVERLERVFSELQMKPKAKTCEAMKGLIAEGDEMVKEVPESALRDAGLIAAANRVEHYEIAAYGSARTFAEDLGRRGIAAILKETLEEEKQADSKLTKIAQTTVNREAVHASAARA
ncbi:MAG TPA: ferritin-like domain-containing protein [Bryobacteraceae bacterium]|jgi:ferritin-like metal-binding protein YciE|nr:ferritin-like domain-containing protein [Bryobacteraceae bacterium]